MPDDKDDVKAIACIAATVAALVFFAIHWETIVFWFSVAIIGAVVWGIYILICVVFGRLEWEQTMLKQRERERVESAERERRLWSEWTEESRKKKEKRGKKMKVILQKIDDMREERVQDQEAKARSILATMRKEVGDLKESLYGLEVDRQALNFQLQEIRERYAVEIKRAFPNGGWEKFLC